MKIARKSTEMASFIPSEYPDNGTNADFAAQLAMANCPQWPPANTLSNRG
jgi:hypothetical protein